MYRVKANNSLLGFGGCHACKLPQSQKLTVHVVVMEYDHARGVPQDRFGVKLGSNRCN